MPTAELIDGAITIVDATYRDNDTLSMLPGAKLGSDDIWRMPLTWTSANALRGMYGDALVLGPELSAWGFAQLENWVNPALTLVNSLSIDEGDDRLYPFQKVGVAWMHTVDFGILADEMGTGKTVQVCTYLAESKPHKTLIVCPNTVKRVWLDHINDWTNLRPVMTGKSAASRRKALKAIADDEADVLIINWEALRLHSRLAPYGSVALKRCVACGGFDPSVKVAACEVHLKELNEITFNAVIADEAHRAKDPASKQTRALWYVARDADARFALTGTPMANTPDELWALLHFVNPIEWPSKVKFRDRYCEQGINEDGKVIVKGLLPTTEAELRRTLDVRMLRRAKSLVLPQIGRAHV